MAADCSCRVRGRRRQAQTVCVEAQGQAFVCAWVLLEKGRRRRGPVMLPVEACRRTCAQFAVH